MVTWMLGGWLIFTYCAVFSLLGFDLVGALEPRWYSALFGMYFFITGVYSAVAAWALLAACVPHVERDRLHDLGKLIVAFSLLATYMMFSQLLPIWYGNLPREVLVPLNRMNYVEWRNISTLLLGTMYLGPLVLLLTIWSKRNPVMLGAVAALVLVSLWIGRWWLVAPTFAHEIEFGWEEFGITMASLAAFCFALDQYRLRARSVMPDEAAKLE